MNKDFHAIKQFFETLKFDVVCYKGDVPWYYLDKEDINFSFKIININGYEVEIFQHAEQELVYVFFIKELGISIPFKYLAISVHGYAPVSPKSYVLNLFINDDDYSTGINITNHINLTIDEKLVVEYLKTNLTEDQLTIMPLGMDEIK